MRTIDADALYRKVKTECNPYGKPTIGFEDGNKVMNWIEQAPTIGGWVSVKDRPPENGQLVVVRHEVKGRIYSEVAHYIMGLWWLDWDSNGLELNAISWTPLSEPEEAK